MATSLVRNRHPVGPHSRPMPRVLGGWAVSYERGTPVTQSTLRASPPQSARSLTHSPFLSLSLTHCFSLAHTHDPPPLAEPLHHSVRLPTPLYHTPCRTGFRPARRRTVRRSHQPCHPCQCVPGRERDIRVSVSVCVCVCVWVCVYVCVRERERERARARERETPPRAASCWRSEAISGHGS